MTGAPEFQIQMADFDSNTNKTPRRLRVFLCYSPEDKAIVRDLCNRLLADGVDPWLAEEELLPGQKWQKKIQEAMRKTDVVVVCLSRKSITQEGYFQKQIKFVLDLADEKLDDTIFIIPLKLEECNIPDRFGDRHWVNLFEERGYNDLRRALGVRANEIEEVLAPHSNLINIESDECKLTGCEPQEQESAGINGVKYHSNSMGNAPVQMPPKRTRNLTTWNYLAVSAIGLLAAVALLLLFIYEAPRLISSGIDGKVFYVLLIPLGLASAAFIFGGMESYARFSGKVFSGALELGGAALIATMVVIGGFYLVPEVRTFNITVRIYDQDSSPIKSGNITIYLEQDARTSPIAANGEANFKEIPLKFRNITTKVLADVKGYKLSGPQTISLSNSVIDIKLVRDVAAILEEIKSLKNDYIARISRVEQVLSSSAANYLNTRQRLLDTVRLHKADLEAYRKMNEVYSRLASIIPNNSTPPNPPDYATMRADLNKAASELDRNHNSFQSEVKRILDNYKQKMAEYQKYGVSEKSDLPVVLGEEAKNALKLLPSTDEFFKMKIVGGVG